MFSRKKPLVRRISAPLIEGNEAYRSLVRHERVGLNSNSKFAMPPLSLESTIQSLLPDPKRDRPRVAEWRNPETKCVKRGLRTIEMEEYLRVTRMPQRLGGLTILEAQSYGSFDTEYVRYHFPSSELEDFPYVNVRTSFVDCYEGCMGNIVSRARSYMDAAPGMGVIAVGLLAQSDEILVLAQETKNFIS